MKTLRKSVQDYLNLRRSLGFKLLPPINEPRFPPMACCHFDRSGLGRTSTRTVKFEAYCALRWTCPAVMSSASCDLGPTIVCLDYSVSPAYVSVKRAISNSRTWTLRWRC